MKKIFYFILAIVAVSCSDTSTDDVSKITNYPVLELNGEEEVFVPLGGTYTEPGIIATEDGAAIPYTIVAKGTLRGSSTLDTNKSDIYNLTYSAVNKDGFTATITRKVIVVDNGDLVTSLSGVYTATTTRDGALTAQYTDMKYLLIWKNDNGSYEISDGIGLYYSVGRAYGDAYLARPSIVTVNSIPNNNYTFPGGFIIPGFASSGPGILTGLIADPASKTITFTSTWTTFSFSVLLKKVQI